MEEKTRIIEDNSHTRNDDDSLDIASKCWERVTDNAKKTGYREGIQDGTDSVLQEGFDIGYKDGFETAFILGRYKGLNSTLSSDLKHPMDIAAHLNTTKRGACSICTMESQTETSNISNDISFTEVLKNQKAHSAKVIERLDEYFQPILKDSNIEKQFTLNKF